MDRNKDLEDAIQILERHPRFPHVQIRARDRMEELEKAHATIRTYTPQAHLELVLLRYDARAEPFLELVADIEKQNAFLDLLESWGDLAWTEYAGGPPDVVRPASDQDQRALRTIHLRREFWVKAGYQQLVNLCPVQTSSLGSSVSQSRTDAGIYEVFDPIAKERRARVDAYIEEVLRETGRKITRSDIWKLAHYKTRTEFQRWQRNDPVHVNAEANRRFMQVLTTKPLLNSKN
jgi:hypothetical protein